MASSGSIYQLPDEVLKKIFSYLNIHDLVVNIQYVDSHWNRLVQDRVFWRDYVFLVDREMADEEIILLLKNMPLLQTLIATGILSSQVIHALCENNRLISRLELHFGPTVTLPDLEAIVMNLQQIQHLAIPLLLEDSWDTNEYSILIQHLQQLKTLTLFGQTLFENHFLTGIANKCSLLHEIDLGRHSFDIQDVTSFLETKKNVIKKFVTKRIDPEVLCLLNACKQLQVLHFECYGRLPSNVPVFDLPNLKHLGLGFVRISNNFSIFARSLHESTMSNLLKLHLNFCELDPVQFESIMTNCVHLKILMLQVCSLPNSNDFKHIAKCTQLECLNLYGSTITDVALKVIAEKCRKLKYLDMCGCPNISDSCIQCLIECSELTTLKVDHTVVTDHNFEFITVHLTKLRELHVEHPAFMHVYERQARIPGSQAKLFCKKKEFLATLIYTLTDKCLSVDIN